MNSMASTPPPEEDARSQDEVDGQPEEDARSQDEVDSQPEKVESAGGEPENNPLIRYRTEFASTSDDGRVSFPGIEQQPSPTDDYAAVMEFVKVCLTDERMDTPNSGNRGMSEYHAQSEGHHYIRILSPAVNEALRCVVDYYPNVDLSSKFIKVFEPYGIFVFYEDQLTEYRERLETDTIEDLSPSCFNRHAARDLKIVQEFVRDKVQSSVEAERERHSRGYVTFDMLWLLFKPGCQVYLDYDYIGEHDPYILEFVDFSLVNGVPTENYTIGTWNIDAESLWVGAARVKTPVDRFAGEKSILELKLYPCEYLRFDPDVNAEDLVRIRQYFIERGKKWYGLRSTRSKKCFYFEGTTTSMPRLSYSSLAIVDPVQYVAKHGTERRTLADPTVEHPSAPWKICQCGRCERLIYSNVVKPRFKGYSRIDPSAQETLTDDQYFICDRETDAFLFKQRSWELVQVSGFKEAKFDKNLLSGLVLKRETKDLIYDLTQMYTRDSSPSQSSTPNVHKTVKLSKVHKQQSGPGQQATWSADFIEGKGECLTFLLHGKPGVGKTYTAECIAAHMERPLLTLTCSDIGVSPDRIEGNLKNWFKLADLWGAIILIDEADIYMEERRTQDIERNHLVAGFIRALEYFRGILFLTTNRVGTFDEAFVSRIHMQIYYNEFDDKERDGVWNTFFDKLEAERHDRMRITQGAKEYTQVDPELRALRWNGREIRNAFQVAVALAEAQGHKDPKGLIMIKSDHIKASVHMSAEFKDYLEKLHKQTQAKRAALLGHRFDAYGSNDSSQGEKI